VSSPEFVGVGDDTHAHNASAHASRRAREHAMGRPVPPSPSARRGPQRRARPAGPTAFALLVAWLVVAPAAHATLDPTTNRQVGGVFSNACGDTRSQVMIRLYDDTLDVERAGKAVKASKLKSSRTAPPGAAIPAFAASVRGQAPGGTVDLTITHDAKGLFARIDGSEAALAPLGPGVVGQVVRHCDPNRNRLPGAPIPLTEQTVGALFKEPGFPAAYRAAIGPMGALGREPWVAKLDGPSANLHQTDVGGVRYWVGTACKPHDCGNHSLVLLWDPAGSHVHGLVQQKGRQTLFGNPPPAVAAALPGLWAREWKPAR
jgi:hypothetical protein